ncbi:hypothetical protein EV363DRAFT_1197200 [Boletus edulis]|nr:hypothetical protein EV363DRAFT_1197200 [Boletus edulis]
MSASKALYSEVLYLQQFGFCQVASAVALLYDYRTSGIICYICTSTVSSSTAAVLLFGSEVDLIWVGNVFHYFFIGLTFAKARDWNLVTFLYATVRYLGIFLILDTIFCLAWYETRTWVLYVFRTAMDIIMMKRIHALSRAASSRFLSSSKEVMAAMVIAFIVKNAVSITLSLLALGPGSHLSYDEYDFIGTHVCGILVPKANIFVSAQIPILVFEVFMFGLAFSYFLADVWGSWRSNESKVWKAGDLVQILVRDSTIYFAIIAAATALDYGNLEASGPTVYAAISVALQNFLLYCFAPRLVLNMRGHKNRVHRTRFDHALNNVVRNEDHLPQGIDQMWNIA